MLLAHCCELSLQSHLKAAREGSQQAAVAGHVILQAQSPAQVQRIFFATVCLGLDLSVAPLLASMTFVINCQNAFYHYKARRKLWDCLGISGEMHIVCRETDCRRDRASPLRLVHRWDHAGLPWRQRQCSGPDDHRRTCAVLHVSRQAMLMTSRMSVCCIRTLKLRRACVSCRVHANGVAAEDRSPVQQPGGRFHHCVSHHTPARQGRQHRCPIRTLSPARAHMYARLCKLTAP